MLALTGGLYAQPMRPPMSIKPPENGGALYVVPNNGITLFDQTGSTTTTDGWPSSFDLTSDTGSSLSTAGADDFVLPAGKHRITNVYVAGLSFGYFGYAYPESFDVIFYSKIKYRAKKTANVYLSCPAQPYTYIGGYGDMLVDVSSCAAGTRFKGRKDYYMSVQGRGAYHDDYQAFYWATRTSQTGKPGLWETYYPDTGAGRKAGLEAQEMCSTWEPNTTCFPSGAVGPDYVFELYGK